MSQNHPFFKDESFTLYQEGLSDNPNLNVYQCDLTGLYFTDVALGKVAYDASQGESSRYDSVQKLEGFEVSKKMIDSINQEDMGRYLQFTLKECRGNSLVDIGAGSGDFIKTVESYFKKTIGFEINHQARSDLNKLGIQTYASWDDFSEEVDIMTLFHVFAEILDPIDFLDHCDRWLSKNGTIILETPNADNILLKTCKNKRFSQFHFTQKHPIVYNLKGIEKIIEASPFKITLHNYVQRYSFSNNFYWLSLGKPGGQNVWPELDTPSINREYISLLEHLGQTDTLQIVLKRKDT